MANFYAVKSDAIAADFTELFHREVDLRYGAPRGIILDRDSKIISKFWAEVCFYTFTKRRLSTTFYPQTDSQTEILNRILKHYLRAYASDEQTS